MRTEWPPSKANQVPVGVWAAPAVPWLSAFPELNVRTYVRVSDPPGVYFFRPDAGRRLAVSAARALLNLPYFAAVMSVEHRYAAVHYQSARRSGRAELNALSEPASQPFASSVGSIEYFLTVRARRSPSIRWLRRVT